MTWNGLTQADCDVAKAVLLWIRTVRESGGYRQDWLPNDADLYKSALFERIRSGKDPLEFPPPVGFACPWYALVEDPGPHFVGRGDFAPHFHSDSDRLFGPLDVSIMQNRYEIVRRLDERDLVVRDAHHKPATPYRFRLWFDPTWMPPSTRDVPSGGWFMQNVAFIDALTMRPPTTD